MHRKLTPRSSLDNLKREAKRWLAALRKSDPDARVRLERSHPTAPAAPALRDVQHALAREHGFAGWTALKAELARADDLAGTREAAIPALFHAAGRGEVERVAALLARFQGIVNELAPLEGNTGRRTALHYGSGHEPVVRVLLAHGADPNIRDDGDDAMPLHFAAERGDLAVVRLLVEHGADPVGAGTMHELNVLGWATCFDYAYHQQVADYLLAHGARHTVHTAVAMGAVNEIRRIARETPAAVNLRMDQTNHRRRPLHLAVIKKRPESLAALLEAGADPEAEDEAGLTALDQAALTGEHAMARQLIAHGARVRLPAAVALERQDDVERLLREEPNALRPGGRWDRLIVRAAERSSGRVVEALLRAGASPNVHDYHDTAVDQTHGFTPLHAAASGGNAEAARVLIRHGAEPAAREEKYWGTPAGWADYFNRPGVRDAILEGPIDIFDAAVLAPDRIPEVLQRDPASLERPFGEYVTGDPSPKDWLDVGWTPVMFALAHGKLDGVHRLIEAGARLDVRDCRGRALLDIARAGGFTEIERLVLEAASRQR